MGSAEAGLAALLRGVDKTRTIRDGIGEQKLDIGYFANVIDIGHGQGLAITTDTAGSKVIIAQMLNKYDTIGIDCLAMNVNDLICVGAEPLAFVDCISMETADPTILEPIGIGLQIGAEQASVSIVGGEIAQVKDIITGYEPGRGFDLAGTAVGIVSLDGIIIGEDISDGDKLIGFRSSGIHCNGMTLARKALFDIGQYSVGQEVPGLGRSLGEELLEPTRIYVDEVMALIREGVQVKSLAHITTDGFLNLTRTKADVSYVIDKLPKPHRIFDTIQEAGNVEDAEMFQVFNMGIGLCAVVAPEDLNEALRIVTSYGTDVYELGYAKADSKRRVTIKEYGLIGEGHQFSSHPEA